MLSNRSVRSWVKTFNRGLRVAFHAFLLATITSELVLPSAYLLHAAETQNAESQKEHNRIAAKLALHQMTADPFLDSLDQLELPKDGPLPANHPSIDKDPFFLRSQVWSTRGEPFADVSRRLGVTAYDFAIEDAKGASTIHWRGSVNQLRLPPGLKPVGITADYIVLSAKEGSDLFTHARQNLNTDQQVGEGIFLIALNEFHGSAVRRNAVPFYFFPLPGNGWTGALRVVEVPTQRKVVVANEQGDFVPLDLEDIEILLNVARVNLMMGYGLSMREMALASKGTGGGAQVDPRALAASVRTEKNVLPVLQAAMGSILDKAGIANLKPAVGSTAMFGMVFTGYDFEHPGNSLFSMGARTSLHEMKQRLQRFARNLLWISNAHADTEAWKILSETFIALAPKLAWVVGVVCGSTLAVSVVQKYTQLKGRFQRRDDEAWAQGVRSGVSQELADISDVLAHNLTVIKTIPYLLAERGFGFLLDRYMADQTACKNSWVRSVFNASFDAYSKRMTNQRVNWRTLLEGVAILGVVDSIMVSVVMCFINPWLWGMVGSSLEGIVPSLNAHISSTFTITNASFMAFAIEESARNWIAWTAGGANSRAQEFAEQGEEIARPIAKRMIASMHFKNSEERKEKEEEIVMQIRDTLVAMQGGPSQEDFLYDAEPTMHFLQSILGYPTPKEQPLHKAQQAFSAANVPPGVLKTLEEFVTNLRAARVQAQAEIVRIKAEDVELRARLAEGGPDNGASQAAKALQEVEAKLAQMTQNLRMTEQMLAAQEQSLASLGSSLVPVASTEARGDVYASARRRPGLYTPALRRAITFLQAEVTRTNSATAKAALACLEKHLADTSTVEAYVMKPARFMAALMGGSKERVELVGNVRRFRAQAMALLYDKALASTEVRHLPGEWAAAFGQPGAELAAMAFQNAYGGYVAGKAEQYLPVDEQAVNITQAASHAAASALQARHGGTLVSVLDTHYTEYKLLALRFSTQEREKNEESMSGVDPREGASNFYLRWQLGWARNRAVAEFQSQTGVSADPFTLAQNDAHFQTFRNILTTQIMRQAAIYPDYAAVPGLEAKINQLTDERLAEWEGKDGVKLKMASLGSDAERNAFREEVRGIFATETYLHEVALKKEVPAMSTAQPGVLAPLRKFSFSKLADGVCAYLPTGSNEASRSTLQTIAANIKSGLQWAGGVADKVSARTGLNTVATGAARLVEGLFPREAHALGIMPQVARTIPLYGHMVDNGMVRTARIFLPYCTGVFAVNYLLWGSRMTFPMFAWNTAWFFGLFGTRAWIESSLRNIGYETQNSLKGAFVHAIFYGLLTNLVYGPMNLLQPAYESLLKTCSDFITGAGQ